MCLSIFFYFKDFRYNLSIENFADNSVRNIVQGHLFVGVAYPLWSAGQLVGSNVESILMPLLWVILPIVAVPWRYTFKKYIYIF